MTSSAKNAGNLFTVEEIPYENGEGSSLGKEIRTNDCKIVYIPTMENLYVINAKVIQFEQILCYNANN